MPSPILRKLPIGPLTGTDDAKRVLGTFSILVSLPGFLVFFVGLLAGTDDAKRVLSTLAILVSLPVFLVFFVGFFAEADDAFSGVVGGCSLGVVVSFGVVLWFVGLFVGV